MAKAIWNGKIIAESDNTVMVDGNHYFPPQSIRKEFFRANKKETTCFWKGVSNYYDIDVDGAVNEAAAWVYKSPKDAAKNIKDHVAFWRGVQVEA